MTGLLSQKQFAQVCGISPQAVNRAIKSERIHLTQKKVDPTHPTNRHYQEKSRNRRGLGPAPPPPPPAAPAAEPPPPQPAGPKTPRRNGNGHKVKPIEPGSILEQLELGGPDMGLYKNQVDVAKGVEQTKALQIKNKEARNELIDRDVVKLFFGELQSIETTELLTLGEKLAPEIAALFGIDDAGAVLDVGKFIQSEMSKTIEHIEIRTERFIQSLEGKEI